MMCERVSKRFKNSRFNYVLELYFKKAQHGIFPQHNMTFLISSIAKYNCVTVYVG